MVRWFDNSKSGSVIIGGQGWGNRTTQLCTPRDLAFDRQGNLYVADAENYRVQMFTIDKSSCGQGTCKKKSYRLIRHRLSLPSPFSIDLAKQ